MPRAGFKWATSWCWRKRSIFSRYRTLLDVGGYAGLLSMVVAKHQPHRNCVTLDVPCLITRFADFRKWAGVAGFSLTALLRLAGACSAAIAYK